VGTGIGTLVLANATDLGMAPLTIERFFFVPSGSGETPANRISAPVEPGGIVIVGLFPAGTYDGLATVTGGFGVPFNDVEIVANQPTTLTLP